MNSATESLTQQIGREVLARARARAGRGRGSDGGGWLERRVMDWGMRDQGLKTRLFQFVDVLPVLGSARQVNDLLPQYLKRPSPPPARLMDLAIAHLPQAGPLAKLIAGLTRWSVGRLGARFIAAGNLDEATDAIQRLRRQRLGFTIDLLGEAVLSDAEALRYQKRYLELIEALGIYTRSWQVDELLDGDHRGPLPRLNVSLKLSSLVAEFDPIDPAGTSAAVRSMLRPILRMARKHNAFVNVDMEQRSFKDVTIRTFCEVLDEEEFRKWSDVGIAIQAYLKESAQDLAELARWVEKRGTPIWIRLVKGAYWDYETTIAAQEGWPAPVFTAKAQTDANFEALTDFLLERHELLRPAIASHNIRSLSHALAVAQQRRLPARSIEFQTLYGMAAPIRAALVEMGQRVRVYTPMGELLPGMAYLVRRLLENTSNESFLRAGFLENMPPEQLLMKPSTLIAVTDAHESADSNPSGFANEPLSDFSREPVQRSMRDALEVVGSQLGQSYPLLIDGQAIQTQGVIESLNPSHFRQVVGRTARATQEHALAAITAAKAAFLSWRDLTAQRRAGYLFATARIMRRRRFELAAWEVYECAKQWREADADVAEAIDYCQYYGQHALRLAQAIHRDVPGEDNVYFYEPRGVAVIIAPWNFPLAILCGMTTAALVMGNTAIMKPSEQSPVIAAKLMEVFTEAGIPHGVVNHLPGIGKEIGPALVSHKDVDVIAFTGSRSVGLEIQRLASLTQPGQDHVKRIITEMGGKNAIIIDDTADLDEAVHGVTLSAFGYAGQKCSACSRVIALAPIHDLFLNRLIESTRSLQIGPAEEAAAFVGPLIDQQARDRVLRYIEEGKREARLAFAADVAGLANEGWFVGPHIFADVKPDAGIAIEEVFGPVLAVLKANDLQEAMQIANSTPYALTGGIYSRTPASIDRARREFRVGNLYINRKITGALVDRQPFGGHKLSGIGSKAGGPDYLQQFVIPRVITENTLRRGFAPAGH